MQYRKVVVADFEPLNLHTLYEHRALDPYRYGEYPRYLTPPGARALPTHEEWWPVNNSTGRAEPPASAKHVVR